MGNHHRDCQQAQEPCPKCLPFVGKVLIDDVVRRKEINVTYPFMSKAIAVGLYHPRCKDSHTTYFPVFPRRTILGPRGS